LDHSQLVIKIPYDDVKHWKALKSTKNIAGFLVEPIQGETGVYVPSKDILKNSTL
jgi:ornithine--oxo-acid transaminase